MYKDKETRNAAQRRYREKNKEKVRQYHRDYMKKWRENKPGQREKERKARKKYYYANQPEEQRKAREYMRAYYQNNKDRYSEYSKSRYQRMREWYSGLLNGLSCEHCGEDDNDCLEFHHPISRGRKNGKRLDPPISTLLSHSKEYVFEQINKCVVLCANCHRKEHARLRRLKNQIGEI